MIFPYVRFVDDLDSNGKNIPGLVTLRKGLRYPSAVLAQEAWESMHKMDPVKLFFRVFRRDDEDQREFEYMGHECEVQAARIIYGLGADAYRNREARSMRTGYDGLFKGFSEEQLAAAMRRRTDKAIDWVREYEGHLRKHKYSHVEK